MKTSRVNWLMVDWSKTNGQIARRYKIDISHVRRKREEMEGMAEIKCPTCGTRILDLKIIADPGNKENECRACWCNHNVRYERHPMRQSSLADTGSM